MTSADTAPSRVVLLPFSPYTVIIPRATTYSPAYVLPRCRIATLPDLRLFGISFRFLQLRPACPWRNLEIVRHEPSPSNQASARDAALSQKGLNAGDRHSHTFARFLCACQLLGPAKRLAETSAELVGIPRRPRDGLGPAGCQASVTVIADNRVGAHQFFAVRASDVGF